MKFCPCVLKPLNGSRDGGGAVSCSIGAESCLPHSSIWKAGRGVGVCFNDHVFVERLQMRRIIAGMAILFSFVTDLSAQRLVLAPELDSAVEMKARGRQGWQINQVIRFGDYSTSKVRRGWTKGYDIDFTVRFRNASQKLSFTQKTPDGSEAEVLAVSRFRSTELDLVRGFLSIPMEYENSFAGTIIPGGDPKKAWEFVLYNPGGSFIKDADCGHAQCAGGEAIYVSGIQKMEGMASWMQVAYFGFEFYRNGKAVAAVSTINNGKVWMMPDLDAETRLVIAAMSSALLLRHDVEQSVSVL
jgi:hypothetical protein